MQSSGFVKGRFNLWKLWRPSNKSSWAKKNFLSWRSLDTSTSSLTEPSTQITWGCSLEISSSAMTWRKKTSWIGSEGTIKIATCTLTSLTLLHRSGLTVSIRRRLKTCRDRKVLFLGMVFKVRCLRAMSSLMKSLLNLLQLVSKLVVHKRCLHPSKVEDLILEWQEQQQLL